MSKTLTLPLLLALSTLSLVSADKFPLEEGRASYTVRRYDTFYFQSVVPQWTVFLDAGDAYPQLESCTASWSTTGPQEAPGPTSDISGSRGMVYTNDFATAGSDIEMEVLCWALPVDGLPVNITLVNNVLRGVPDTAILEEATAPDWMGYTAPACAYNYEFYVEFPEEGYYDVTLDGPATLELNDGVNSVELRAQDDYGNYYDGLYDKDDRESDPTPSIVSFDEFFMVVPAVRPLDKPENCDLVQRRVVLKRVHHRSPTWVVPVTAIGISAVILIAMYSLGCCGAISQQAAVGCSCLRIGGPRRIKNPWLNQPNGGATLVPSSPRPVAARPPPAYTPDPPAYSDATPL